MPVRDFPTIFPTTMKFWLNRMVISENSITHTYIYMRCIYYIYVHLQSCTYISDVSKRGVLGSADDDIACFLHILSILVVIYFFCWSWACFFGEYLHILHIYNTILHLFCILWQIVYCSWKDLFAIYMHILHICSTWKTRDGRKCVKNFGVLGVSGLNK